MASIEKRISKSGERTYHITVCAGYGLDGKKVRRRTTYKPDANMSDKQADKAAQKEAFRFEQQLEQGYVMEDNQRFQEYAEFRQAAVQPRRGHCMSKMRKSLCGG